MKSKRKTALKKRIRSKKTKLPLQSRVMVNVASGFTTIPAVIFAPKTVPKEFKEIKRVITGMEIEGVERARARRKARRKKRAGRIY